ncbi:hypothetical protein G5V57_23680 [Nordella sp. HKS 07]|uniref:hypothetical protein n=1 Tax=Nordella sp. HKS 07 TaxID=2712222 RepID=UPI0013E0FED8|nr:hypothetical protein [Nordella sp. HKS 07]QIG50462.1 hypothetical protein G5V57_23680 [Nordella sp. HKS 07]
MAISRVITAVAALLSGVPDAISTEPWQGRDSPFVLGEVLPETTPATCASVKHWAAEAPQVDDRVSFAIVGRLVSAEWDGTLAYLIMCPESDIQVMCVTYSKGRARCGRHRALCRRLQPRRRARHRARPVPRLARAVTGLYLPLAAAVNTAN